MFETTDETILQFVEDYRVHLIVPKEIQDFSKFATDFGKALKYIAVSEDKGALEKLQSDEEFQCVDVKTVQLLNECTNSNIPINKGEGETNMDMCKGLKELLEDKRTEGEQEGRREGRQEGQQEGIKLTKKVFQLNRAGKSNEDIAKECNIPVSQVEEILE